MAHAGRRPADAALPPARRRFAHGRPRWLLRRPSAKDLKDLSAVGRKPTLRYVPITGVTTPARSHRLDAARFRRGTYQTVRVPGARPRPQAHQPRNDASDRQLAVFLRE